MGIAETLLGVLVSGLVQLIKRRMGTSATGTLFAVALLSLGVGGVYVALVSVGYWETFYKVLMAAGAVYAFVISRFEKSEE